MFACLDVYYHPNGSATTGCVIFQNWMDAAPQKEVVTNLPTVAPYQPGAFYLRELPCLLSAIRQLNNIPEIILIDGYVWLDGQNKPGLGAHLYRALNQQTSIIGIAKTHFASAAAIPVNRGISTRPLLVTTAGMDEYVAAQHIASMHGEHRIPTLIRRADQLCRGIAVSPLSR